MSGVSLQLRRDTMENKSNILCGLLFYLCFMEHFRTFEPDCLLHMMSETLQKCSWC